MLCSRTARKTNFEGWINVPIGSVDAENGPDEVVDIALSIGRS
jgi:hypothetical protein